MKLDKIKNYIFNILFPIKCIGCNKIDCVVCNECLDKIPQAERETERNIIALFDYRNELIRKIIWELKYHHKRYLAEELGILLYESMIEEISNLKLFSIGSPIVIIPVPISKNKTIKRGYNQSFYIAKGFSRNNKEMLKTENNIIFRKTDSKSQARISNRKERLLNVQNAFGIKNEEKIKDKIVIVIDDVTTTGGTITEIMKLLKQNEAKKVIGMAVAH